jgi:WD40 repeat protein
LDDAYTLTALALSPDAKAVASAAGYTDYPIRLWDVASGQEIGPLEGHRACIFSMVFWPDGKTLAAASADQTIRLWDLTDLHRPRSLRTLRGHQSEVGPLVLLPDHTTLVSGCKDGSVCVWDTKAIQRERTHVTLPEPILTWRGL